MNANTGQLYDSKEAALLAGELADDIVEINGTRKQVESISADVRRANRKRQKAARKKNRK